MYADVRAQGKKLCKEDMYVCPLNRDIYIYIYIYILYALHVQIEKGHFSCGGGVAAKRLSPRSSDVELWVQSLPWCRFVRHETLLDFVSLHQGV